MNMYQIFCIRAWDLSIKTDWVSYSGYDSLLFIVPIAMIIGPILGFFLVNSMLHFLRFVTFASANDWNNLLYSMMIKMNHYFPFVLTMMFLHQNIGYTLGGRVSHWVVYWTMRLTASNL